MNMPTYFRFAVFAAFAAGSIAPRTLSAQIETRYSIPAGQFVKPKFTQAVLTSVPGGLQVQALDRQDLFISAPLVVLPPSGNFEITRVVVHFRNPKYSGAALISVLLTSEYGSKLLDVHTYAQNDRSTFEMYQPAGSANAWRMPTRNPPTTVNTKTIVRLGISSSLPIDPDGAGPPPPNYQPKGQPFVLLSVDVYVKIPLQIGPIITTKLSPGGIRPAPTPAQVPAPPAPAKPIPNLPGSKGVIYVN